MVFCSSAWVADTWVFTPPTSVETSAILALAGAGRGLDLADLAAHLLLHLGLLGLDLAGELLGVRLRFGLRLAGHACAPRRAP